MLAGAPPVTRYPLAIGRFPAEQLRTRTLGVAESWALARLTVSRPLRPDMTEAGNFLAELRGSRRPGFGDFDACSPSTLSAFRANRTTCVASRAASPSGVIPATATTRAAMDRTIGKRLFIVSAPFIRLGAISGGGPA